MYSERLCPLCNSSKKKKFESLNIEDGSMHVSDLSKLGKNDYFYVLCLDCGMMYLDDSVEESIIEGIYNNDYWTDSKEDPENLAKLSRQFCRAQCIASMISERGCKPNNTLDIGGGLGGVALGIKHETNSTISIVDRSQRACEQAKIFGFNSEKDISTYKNLGNTFDLVILCHSLEHFNDPISLINEIRTVTNSKSFIYIEVPNAKWHSSSELFHETMWTKRLLKKFLYLVGIENIDVWESNNPYHNSVNLYLHAFGKMGNNKRKPRALSSKYDVFISRYSRKNYHAYLFYNSLIDKIPSFRFRKLFPLNYRKTFIPNLDAAKNIISEYKQSNN